MTDQQAPAAPSASLSEIFVKMNMGELPAMSHNVQKLISLTNSKWSTSADLAKVILQDYSLTNKVLQVVNSAYYSLGQPCNSISQAVNILGFDAIRDMAMVIALFEDFIKSGVDREGISKLLACSFSSGIMARILVEKKKINVPPEEAFICSLFYNLGKNIVCIYLPDKYRAIELKIKAGLPANVACREVLIDLSFHEIGAEVAKFWNLSERVVSAMEENPKPPKHQYDIAGYLALLAHFSNTIVDSVCDGSDLEPIFQKHGGPLSVEPQETIALLNKCVDISEAVSDSIRYGFSKHKIRTKLRNLEINASHGLLNSNNPSEQPKPAAVRKRESQEAPLASPEQMSVDNVKLVQDFMRESPNLLMGPFDINKYYFNLLSTLYRGLGFDRVILAVVNAPPVKQTLLGGFGFGEIEPDAVSNIEHIIASQTPCAISHSLKLCRDMMVPANKATVFPENIQSLVKDRIVYLFPICIDGKGIGMIYLDRKSDRPLLDQRMVKMVGLFRDFAVKAICIKIGN